MDQLDTTSVCGSKYLVYCIKLCMNQGTELHVHSMYKYLDKIVRKEGTFKWW